MTDLDSVYAAVVRHPADDLPRLAYADLLEDRAGPGDDARAQFVRAQVAEHQFRRLGAEVLAHKTTLGGQTAGTPCPDDCPRCGILKARTLAETLFAANAGTPGDPLWWQPGPAPIAPWALYCHRAAFLGSRLTPAVLFRRGFPCAARVGADAALGRRCDRCGGSGRVSVYLRDTEARMSMGLQELSKPRSVGVDCPKCKGARRLDLAARALFADHPLTELAVTDSGDQPGALSRPDLVAKFREHHGLPPA